MSGSTLNWRDREYTFVECPKCRDYVAVDKEGRVICICGYNENDGRWARDLDKERGWEPLENLVPFPVLGNS